MVLSLEHTMPDAHDPTTGRFDALRVANTLALSTREIAGALGRSPQWVRRDPDAPGLQRDLARLVRVLNDLRGLLGSVDNARIWLRAPHPDLGNRTPMSYLVAGQPEPIEAMIWAIRTGEPG